MSVRLSSFAASIRLANFPSVWCNVLTGVGLSFLVDGTVRFGSLVTLYALLSASCLYGCGNLLNDWWDRDWDLIHRPERALPQRVFSPWVYLLSSMVFGGMGFGFAWIASPQASVSSCVILLAILAYTLLHKRTPMACIAMALCRGALPWLGLLVNATNPGSWPTILVLAAVWFSLALFIHTVSVSLATRICPPHQEGARSVVLALTIGVFAASTAVASASLQPGFQWYFAFSALPYIAAMAISLSENYRKNPHMRVSWLLACFPLLDAVVLIPLSNLIQQPESTAAIIVPPVCLVLALWLQKHTSAT
jgi:heme O synthase-like polyprenyltransferase